MMSLPRLKLLSYGQFGLVMAFVGLPIYVHAPKFYAEVLGLPLSLLGVLLFLPRLVDAVQDPYIGRYCDKLALRGVSRLKVMLLACPLLALTFFKSFCTTFFWDHRAFHLDGGVVDSRLYRFQLCHHQPAGLCGGMEQ